MTRVFPIDFHLGTSDIVSSGSQLGVYFLIPHSSHEPFESRVKHVLRMSERLWTFIPRIDAPNSFSVWIIVKEVRMQLYKRGFELIRWSASVRGIIRWHMAVTNSNLILIV